MVRVKDITVGLGVPVMSNFSGFTEMIASVDYPVRPLIYNNWTTNHGVAVAWNTIIARAINLKIPYLIIANDDLKFAPETILKLVKELTMDDDEQIDLVSAVNHDTQESHLVYDSFPDYSCYAIRPKQFRDKFGMFDEKFRPAYFEDNDMHYRIKLAGGVSALRQGARVFHKGSVTQYMNPDKPVVPSERFEENRHRYIMKWGGQPREEVYKTPFGDPTKAISDW